MKILFYFQFLLLGNLFIGALPYNEIEVAFEENDASSLISYCENPIFLKVGESEGIYNHAQASMVLMEFFKKYPNGAFNYEFKGKEEHDVISSMASYMTEADNFSVVLSFSNELDNKVQSIEIRN